MLRCEIPSHAVKRARDRIPHWKNWDSNRVKSEIFKRLPSSKIVNSYDKIYSTLERGNHPKKNEMVCFTRDDIAIYVLKRDITQKSFRVSTVYFAREFDEGIIQYGTYLFRKGQLCDLMA